ncbi:outer membrane protein assembly factor BamD [Stagnimonas aquatica]|uniref:Outer membrane protein assembly factor BamD n=1 Tax=Stagnimonas aquatica TaxID=2689987 RepID=A0A3N0VJR8_9GAMM|nr:outer membrane protein assembly factor BamD [Stagnimonas aquatica]ROH92996.1 outer membrane protein assembly factor BamD [Stagnimonas aquatica]
MKSSSALKLAAATLASVLWLTGCSSDAKRDPSARPVNPFKDKDSRSSLNKSQVSERELKLEADQLYRVARKALDSSDFTEAQTRYDTLIERYPFTEYAVQAELEKIYAMQREFRPDEALAAADRFLREHPRHAGADYVQYLKGVIQAERDAGLLDSLPLDHTKGDVGSLRKAYDEFSLLIQKYPNSRYGEDARARMVDLRNRIAANEMHVVHYYERRGAHLAAAKRAEQIIAQYPGAPATLEALKTLQKSYTALGLKQQADDAARILAAQPAASLSDRADSSASAPAPAPEPGVFSRIAGAFSFLDSSKRETTELVIPTGEGKTATPQTGEGGISINGSPLRVSINTGDEEAAAATPAPAAAAPAEEKKGEAPAEKRGFFTRVVDFFSFLDPDRKDEKK